MDYRNQLVNNDWNYIEPNIINLQKIIIFDDGNHEYEMYPNEWIVFGRWKGKTALFNKMYPTIVIKSISSWKVCHFV
jgi:hypothetical protein